MLILLNLLTFIADYTVGSRSAHSAFFGYLLKLIALFKPLTLIVHQVPSYPPHERVVYIFALDYASDSLLAYRGLSV